MKTYTALLSACVLLSGCGGGSGTPGSCVGSAAVCTPPSAAKPVAPASAGNISFTPSSKLAQQCAAPRPPGSVDPYTQVIYNDQTGTLATELSWIRSFVNETYLWFDEVPVVDPNGYVVGATVSYVEPSDNVESSLLLTDVVDATTAYFNSQRTPLSTPSGKPKDQFHFTYPTAVWSGLSQAGAAVGYGMESVLLASRPPRSVTVAYVTAGTTAATNGITRGTQILTANGVDVANGTDVDTLNEALFSPVDGKTYTFSVLDRGSSGPRTVTLTAGSVQSIPVQNVGLLPASNGTVGYVLFNDHIATAESELIAAVNQLKAANNGAGVDDLVLDLRYNGGGFLDIASELSYMIAGAAATTGKVFERESFNSKNPFGLTAAQTTTAFWATTQGFSTTSGEALPQLNLGRVFVLTGAGTCSASEAIINGLRGAGINVIQIGATTCGKPYGFFPQENCSTTYFAVQFKGVNDAGFGDYADGFIPAGTGTAANNLAGCAVADDFTKELGDPTERRLAAALQYRADGTCPVAPVAKRAGRVALDAAEPVMVRPALRENRWLSPRRTP